MKNFTSIGSKIHTVMKSRSCTFFVEEKRKKKRAFALQMKIILNKQMECEMRGRLNTRRSKTSSDSMEADRGPQVLLNLKKNVF